jgi:serine O-acetyltransferase
VSDIQVSATAGEYGRPVPPAEMGQENRNPAAMGWLSLVAEDLRTHDGNMWEQGFWAVATHRFGNWRMSIKPKIARVPFSLIYKLLYKWVEWTCGISLPYTTKIGRRVRIWHHSGIILSAQSIGDDVQIRQNTTMGVVRTQHSFELPIIGDRVDIGCGAVILGNITIGDDSVIGANAVVLKDVPPSSIAVGVPARVIPRRDQTRSKC